MPSPLVMLHGAVGAGESLLPLATAMRPYASVETPNLIGHGGRPVPERLTVPEIANDILGYMDGRNIARAFLFGYSFGGYIALYLARHFPQRLSGVCLLAAKYVFDAKTVQHFTHLANPDRISRPGTTRAAELAVIHAPQSWVDVATQNRRLFVELGAAPAITEEDLRAIALPTLIFSSNEDQLVPLAETLALGNLIPGSRIALFRGQAHPLATCPIDTIAKTMGEWLAEVEASWNAAWTTDGLRASESGSTDEPRW